MSKSFHRIVALILAATLAGPPAWGQEIVPSPSRIKVAVTVLRLSQEALAEQAEGGRFLGRLLKGISESRVIRLLSSLRQFPSEPTHMHQSLKRRILDRATPFLST